MNNHPLGAPQPPWVLAIDQGTTNSKALLVDAHGRVAAKASHALAPIATPRPGWFEQDPDDLWRATSAAIDECLSQVGGPREVTAVAISNQRESVVAWRRSTGDALGPVLGWQDGRTAGFCSSLREAGADALVHERTGLTLDPMFSAPKMRWLLDDIAVPLDDVCVGTIDAYLLSRLTGRCVTEAGNASRTLLFNLRTLDWDDDLLALFGVPRGVLPDVVASSGDFGVAPRLSGVPVTAVMGDSHAALYGQGLTSPGAAKVTYGTGSSVMAPVGEPGDMPATVSTTLAWLQDGPTFAREGNIIATGAALDALATMLRLPGVGALIELASRPAAGAEVSYVPAFSGLGAPYWDRAATGVLVGLARDTSAATVAWAGLDAVAQQVCDVIEAIDATGQPIEAIHADGGASTSGVLMQLQADLSGRLVHVKPVAEASALGVARMAWRRQAGGDVPGWQDEPARTYRPRQDSISARARWHEAVARSRGTATQKAGR